MTNQKNLVENLELDSLKYLAGVKKHIEECGMMGLSPTAPQAPASINVTAASGEELSDVLKTIMSLAGTSPVTKNNMPIDNPDSGPSKVISAPPMSNGGDMKALLSVMDQDVDEDSMNPADQQGWDNSPNQDGKAEGNWPIDGNQDNNLSANKDKIVSRHEVTAEDLFSRYENFVAESKKSKCCCKEKGKKKCPVHGKMEEGFRPLLPQQKIAGKKADLQAIAQSGRIGAGPGPEMANGGTGRVPFQSKEYTKYIRDRAANAEQKRKEQDNGKQPIEPRDQMVGVAKVKQGVAEAGPRIAAAAIQGLYDQGVRPIEIARQLGRTSSSISKLLDKLYPGREKQELRPFTDEEKTAMWKNAAKK